MRYAPGRFDLSDVQSTPVTKSVRAFTCAPAVAGADVSDRQRERDELYHQWVQGGWKRS